MDRKLMLLTSHQDDNIILVQMPNDMEKNEAFRCATGLIGNLQQENPDYSNEDIKEALEEYGFNSVEFMMGPRLS